MQVTTLLKKYGISLRTLATLIGVSPATINYWENNHSGLIPAKFQKETEEAFSSIDKISVYIEVEPKDIIPLIIEFKKSPFFKGWPHLVLTLSHSLDIESISTDSSLTNEIERYIAQDVGEVKVITKCPKKLAEFWGVFDLCLETVEKKYVFVYSIEKAVSLPDIVDKLNNIQNAFNALPNSTFYIFAHEIGNSVRFAIQDFEYINLVNTQVNQKVAFRKVR